MRIDLPFPDKILWPNGPRPRNDGHKASVVKKHHEWAYLAALEAKGKFATDLSARPLPVTIEVHAKPRGPLPDKDNCIAAAKSSLDGIARAIGVNDRHFDAPAVTFSPERDGRFVVVLGDGENSPEGCGRSSSVLNKGRAGSTVSAVSGPDQPMPSKEAL